MRPAKRALDLVGALVGLVLFAPVLAAVALAVFVSLGRPVLFRQERSGHHGRPFRLLKFRTMRHPVPGEEGPEHDHLRVTRLGRFLRATSLDELPELWNVLRGEMSLVGPRPLPMHYVSRYTRRQARRLEVPPGLTGWAQVNGRNTVGWDDRFELDVWYVDHASLALDLRILGRTVLQVLRRDGIDHAEGVTMHEFRGPAVIDLADTAAAGGSAGLPLPPPSTTPLPPPLVPSPGVPLTSVTGWGSPVAPAPGSPVAPAVGANDAAGRGGAGVGARWAGRRPVEVLVVSDLDRCRAPITAALLARALRDRAIDAVVGSAGLRAEPGGPADPAAVLAATPMLVDLRAHRARRLHAGLLRSADLIVTMGRAGLQAVVDLDDEAAARAFTLGQLAASAQVVGTTRLGLGGCAAGATAPVATVRDVTAWVELLDGVRVRKGASRTGPAWDADLARREVADPTGRSARVHTRTALQLERLVWQVTDYLPTFERAPAPRVLDLRDRTRVA